MKSRLILAVFTTIALMAANSDTVATEKLSLRVTPNVSAAPSNVIVKATIAKDAANRWLTIEADSGAFYRSSAIQLDGDKAPTVTEIRLSNLPSGEYAVSAILRNNLGQETTVRRTVIVLARFAEP
ncbi:MAG TPA: hypothetical protein VJ691_07740 [Vicinamibacterales bacterium]|nr:hypothetical protein [Vicinamibacterales bacterium]